MTVFSSFGIALLLTTLLIHPFFAAADEEVLTTRTRTRTIVHGQSADTIKEKELIKSRLEGTEARVRSLLADLETFSSTATKAKAEIHTSLLETWTNVENLARDRCGTELETVRTTQRKAEARVADLQDELRQAAHETENLKLSISKSSNTETHFKTELGAERSRREAVEAEVHELRDKLHWASATANETQTYDLVAERLEALLLVVSERSQMLQRVLTMVSDHHAGYEDWRVELSTLGEMVRDANKGFSGGLESAASDAQARRVSDLERRLKDAQRSRDDAVAERNQLRNSYDKLRVTGGGSGSGSSGGFSAQQNRIIYQTTEGYGFLGMATAVIMTLLCGALMLVLCNFGTSGGGGGGSGSEPGTPFAAASARRGSNAFTPDRNSGTPSGNAFNPSTSPVTYPGSGQRQTTPRRY